jgi:hypothetical protein
VGLPPHDPCPHGDLCDWDGEVVPAADRVSIWLRRRLAGRATLWTVNCARCGEVARERSKPAASKAAVAHAEDAHERRVRIHVPV